MISELKNNSGAIIVTGAAGFIGSCMVQYLNELGYTKLILVDAFNSEDKVPNLKGKEITTVVERDKLFAWLYNHKPQIDFVIHLGARTDTTEFNYSIHQQLNVEFTQNIWNYCTVNNVPLIYASSAATYGDGTMGYKDDHELCFQLQPLNPYGISKNEVDKWVLHQEDHPPFWAGLKFFNVYGPNEYHKGRMASVIFHSFNQIQQNGFVKLFRSHKEGFNDGEQLRDFIYVKDVIKVIAWMMKEVVSRESSVVSRESSVVSRDPSVVSRDPSVVSDVPASQVSRISSAVYNLGTGKARTFHDLVKATFDALHLETKIEFIDMPEDIRDKYQYFTEADMNKLRSAGYTDAFASLEEGVADYVQHYLSEHKYY